MTRTKKKKLRPKKIRDWQRQRTKEWRQRWYALGYTYKKIDGHWGWIKKKSRFGQKTRIHSTDPNEIERIRQKIQRLKKKKD